jgi:hypothetical protein
VSASHAQIILRDTCYLVVDAGLGTMEVGQPFTSCPPARRHWSHEGEIILEDLAGGIIGDEVHLGKDLPRRVVLHLDRPDDSAYDPRAQLSAD